ncbi:MAG: cation-translocating P-type ATPase [Cytophagaceae bacterium]|nr:cation-translocating P-type ATPase [Cytophagaceae bacterium]
MKFETAYVAQPDIIARDLKVDLQRGLSEEEAKGLLEKYGPNAIESEKKKSIWKIFFFQFKSPMVLLLMVAAGLSFYFQEYLDGVAILIVILINALIGFYMEFQATRSMNALKKLVSVPAKVIRNGKLREIPSEGIVPGDILFVEAGDMILSDARIFQSMQFEVDESALTGESLPVAKASKLLTENTPLAERTNMLYKGTFVTKGNSKAIVTGTGMNTELGKIASMVHKAEQAATPLEKKLEKFSKKLIWITLALVIVIFIAGLMQDANFVKVIETSIALAVAAIPEGLPIVATLALAQGMLRMAKHNVIVKKLAAVETLGGTNVICTDKTGTLTENKIEVNTIEIPSGKSEIKYGRNNQVELPKEIEESQNYKLISQSCVLCNTANLEFKGGQTVEVGDPLEVGLLKYAVYAGINIEALRNEYPEIREEAFSSETKLMGTLNKVGEKYMVFAKGAVEELIARCRYILIDGVQNEFDQVKKTEWISKSETMAAEGLRLLGYAYKDNAADDETFMKDLTFLGILGLLDPARKEVPAAIAECKSAGIKVIMITGDHPATAKNIGLKLGLLDDVGGMVMHGNEMKDYSSLMPEDKKRWLDTKIFARVTPKQKIDLVTLLQEDKSIVGMTGDGVNDAPAIKKADIGISMGLRGTQVAQEVSDMVLKDDSFTSIVVAIKQGRIIFENIKKFVTYLLSCNMSELFVVASASLMNLHFALIPLQILFINLITDVLPALALGVSEGNPLIMQNKPRDPETEIISTRRWIAIVVYAAVLTGCVLSAVFFSHYFFHNAEGWNPALCNNILFYTLIFSQLWHVLNMASAKASFFNNEVVKNKYVWMAIFSCLALVVLSYWIPVMRKVLGIYPMSYYDWLVCLGFSGLSLVIIQILKRIKAIL